MNPLTILFFLVGIGIASISKELNPGYGFVHGYWPALLGLCVSSGLWIYLQAQHHAELSKTVGVTHWKWNILRFAMAVLYIVPVNIYDWHTAKAITLLIFGMCWFGFIFNPSYALAKGFDWDYLAKSGKKRALSDMVFGSFHHGGKVLAGLELIGMIVSGWVYIHHFIVGFGA